jgi:catechol 2,3-dioxygenase-like lactoylglutathione lyase family enzyme
MPVMPRIKLDAVSVTSRDMARSVKFYEAIGFDFPEAAAGQDHIEAVTRPGEVRLMIDSAELIEGIIGRKPVPSTHSAFAILCETPAAVDAAAAAIGKAGFTVVKQPWDAFWGQRYAVVADPEGYMVDLFAPLS